MEKFMCNALANWKQILYNVVVILFNTLYIVFVFWKAGSNMRVIKRNGTEVDFGAEYRRLPMLEAIKEYAGVDIEGMSEAELARSIGTSPSAFNQRMKTGKFSTEEMDKIAEVLEAEYYFGFQFKDGTKI